MKRILTPEQRLVIAADFKPEGPNGRDWALVQFMSLVISLEGTGVCIKVNSLLRACGYGLLTEIKSVGLQAFADLKLYDIPQTLGTDGALLREFEPDLLTVFCLAGQEGIQSLKTELPRTEVLGVTVLTSMGPLVTVQSFGSSVQESVLRFAKSGLDAGVDGLVCAPAEAKMVRDKFVGRDFTIVTPNIRPEWSIVSGDDQNPKRAMTPKEAIGAGADRIVVGRPITQAESPYEAVMRTLEEIASVT